MRALSDAPPGTSRIAATWFSTTTFAIGLAFNDTLQHQVAIYCLDWDTTSRAETVNIFDANNILLATQNVTNFNGGQSGVAVERECQIQVISTAGANAVISGLFFQ